MFILFWITTIIIIVYLLYPVWLILIWKSSPEQEKETEEINSVSLILLSFNGKKYLEEKITFLLGELSFFQNYELIIIDDHSTDGSPGILNKYSKTNHIKIICNSTRRGIPYSMNSGIITASYNYVIFCDQRQRLSTNIVQKIVEPLKYRNVGAVSGCVSAHDKEEGFSLIRRHENFLKSKESKSGSLIGVYGPFYAIKKQCYSIIPEDIILDDLYLSLKILRTKKIELREDCEIFDNDFSLLYDYQRTRRYLSGLLQIMKEKSFIRDLSYRQHIMLIWHKYLRLLIPFFLFSCYLLTGLLIFNGTVFVIGFGLVTATGVLSILPGRLKFQFRLKNLVRTNILYFMAFFDIFFNDILLQREVNFRDR
jgi:poly-beta-1,6-N-acetyl-D-glucosamine synthase